MENQPIIYNTALGDIVIFTRDFLKDNFINLTWKKISDLSPEEKQRIEENLGLIGKQEKLAFPSDLNYLQDVEFGDNFIDGLIQSQEHHFIWESIKNGGFNDSSVK